MGVAHHEVGAFAHLACQRQRFGIQRCVDGGAGLLGQGDVACIDSKVPEAGRTMLKQGLDQTKAAWKQAAATPQGKAGLAQACVQAEASAKQAMGAYGCAW